MATILLMLQCGHMPLRGGGSIIRNIVGFRWRFRLLSSAEWWVHRGGKRGKQGRRETVFGNGTYCPPPLFPLSSHLRVRTIPQT